MDVLEAESKVRDGVSAAEAHDRDGATIVSTANAKCSVLTPEPATVARFVEGNRERNDRFDFPYVQSIAPYVKGSLPKRDHFRDARFHDISTSGFSFYSEERPRYDALVAGLGTSTALNYFTARVSNVQELSLAEAKTFLVGCQFTGRVIL